MLHQDQEQQILLQVSRCYDGLSTISCLYGASCYRINWFGCFQEADILGITTPITKHNYQVRNIKDIPRIIKEAFYIASTGRPGPVLIDFPKDIAIQ